ncbi:hypothetical protein [Ensifer sp. NM-2]|uniref:hypothetical protein n=1 Tax=Ensifer sp. NM-2 TaxID=2109730 RepID=UPI0011B256D1|nr:hypothetical protein [Ensifer sp. NM-2]
MENEIETRWKGAIRRLGRTPGRDAETDAVPPERFQHVSRSHHKEGWVLFSRHMLKTTLPVYTELAVPGGNSVLLLSEYAFNARQLDAIGNNIARARDYAQKAATLKPSDNKTLTLLKHHFKFDYDPDEFPSSNITYIHNNLQLISEGLSGPNVTIKLHDSFSDDGPEYRIDGLAKKAYQTGGREAPKVRMRLATRVALSPEEGPRVIIHEGGHNAAGLDDHGERGYVWALAATKEGQPLFYRKGGLTSEEAFKNADSYAAFCCDLQRCPPTIMLTSPSTEKLQFPPKGAEERFSDGTHEPSGEPVKTTNPTLVSKSSSLSSANGRSQSLDDRPRSPLVR